MQSMEENRSWWGDRASNPVGGAMRSRVGSTPILFRRYNAQYARHARYALLSRPIARMARAHQRESDNEST